MRHFAFAIILLASALISGASFAASMQKGWEAYENGDYATALKEWRPLAERGNANMQYNLGLMYVQGRGVLQDLKQAVYWWRLAAEQGYDKAQVNLGVMYNRGEGVLQDYKQAVYWYRLAAEQGDANAQALLGWSYFFGEGVSQDYRYALMWLNIARMNGNGNAGGNYIVAKEMTPAQIEEAQSLARQCVAQEYRDCDKLKVN
jgi:TPR repeat protein